ncbi:hypothetical protein ACPC54_38340 [Kitasatospora sp. NPDC094028]
MTTSTAIPTARERKSRTRTTNVSSQPALLVSKLPLSSVQLTHRAEVLACPACATWCPLTLDKGTKRWKIAPHHTDRAGTPGARRCSNSNRLVVIDVQLARWQEQRVEASADAAARRPTKVLRKVKTPITPALNGPVTADTVYVNLSRHRATCAACTDEVQCRDGLSLLAAHKRLLKSEKQSAKAAPARRVKQWADVDEAVAKANTTRQDSLVGARSPIQGAAVPVGARPIATIPSSEKVLALNPIRKDRKTAA